jgi:hypothetical protein
MTIDEDSRNPEADPQRHSQGAIHSPHIQNHRHIASAVRRLMQDCCDWPSQQSSRSQQRRFYADALISRM